MLLMLPNMPATTQRHQATKFSNTDEVAKPTLTAYINLHPVACSADFQTYQQSKGIQATVYTAHSTLPSTIPSVDAALELKQTLQQPSLLSFAFAMTTPVPDPSAQDQGDNKTDILTQSQMFKATDQAKFIQCQADKIASLYDLDIMDAKPMSTLPPSAKLLSSIWSYCQKCLPNGILSKYKSRLCLNGKKQAFGLDYWETYAPVAAISTIWLLLYLSTILDLQTRQIDSSSAFSQAVFDVPVYMKVAGL